MGFTVFASSQETQAGKTCVSCFGEVADSEVTKRNALRCKHDHIMDRSCVVRQLSALDHFEELLDLGLKCGGLAADDLPCEERFSLSRVFRVLHQRQRLAVKKRIALSSAPMTAAQLELEVTQLKQKIQDSFVLSCPVEGCGSALDRVEGCNAAKCSHYLCGRIFCYLCLAKLPSLEEAHLHVRDLHSGDFWEYRPGYLDRYHWLLARKNLAAVFRLKVHPDVRTAALKQLEPLLREHKMWSFPAGVRIESWLTELRASDLTQDQKIEILQNEAIHRLNSDDSQGVETLERELLTLGGTPLRSLDRLSPSTPVTGEGELVHLLPGHPNYYYVFPPMDREYMHGDGREDVFMTPNWQKNGSIIWGPLFMAEGDLRFAREQCSRVDGRLPTQEDLWALARALGAPDPEGGNYQGLNASRLPGLDSEFLWGFTPEEDEYGVSPYGRVYSMDSVTGVVIDETDEWSYNPARFRCVYD